MSKNSKIPESKQDNNKKVIFSKKEILAYLLEIIVVVFIVTMCLRVTVVDGSSMYPTLVDQQKCFTSPILYMIGSPKRFDVIVIDERQKPMGKYLVKRIIGLPGEKVRIDKDGIIYINGEILEENYGYETILDPGLAINEIQLGDDEYFVLGDNRNHSGDSRFEAVGNIPSSDIVGKLVFYK